MIIRPYESVGEIRFGMSKEEVTSVLGKPVISRTDRSGEVELDYIAQVLMVSSEGVVEVGIMPRIPVTIEGISVFSDPDAFPKLCRIDGDPKESLGVVVLFNLGISMGGFHDHDESQKAVTAFARGRWDEFKSEMTSFRLAGS